MSWSSCRSQRLGLRRAPPPCQATECGRAEPCRACPERSRPTPPAGPRGWMSRALLLGVLILSLTSPAQSFSPVTDLNTQQETGVCQSLDIRNGPEMFNLLSGCRVVEGFLQILLFDRFNETAYTNLTFPELREITGYLMMYRVNGLKTLSTLFPNLAVIRGHKLFNNYAFILYEMMDMDEIGLYSLTDITRGSVRIEKNFKLCYVSTIDWDIIAASGKEAHYIKDNKPGNECSVCPIELACPLVNKRHLCWNKFHCQKVCASECGTNTCSASGECCDNSCLGGCSGRLNCTVCRDLSIGDLRDRKCIKDCPNNTFKHQERRCISEAECRKLPPPREFGADKQERPYKPINGTCMLQCPPNFDEERGKDGMYRCVECKGACRKECPSMNVDSIQAIEKLKGCTHIIGSLEISIRGGGSIVKELEEGLGLIQEITGSLKVARSYPLVSLNFLKSLRVIRGDHKYGSDVNALMVTDNQNLQELWDWKTHGPIDIMHGKLFFHFNPKLCIEKIEPLQQMARETQFNDLEVARNSNGDKVACNVTLLNVTVEKRMQVSMLLSWEAFMHDDSRSLLGYVVHSIESENQNISLYEGRDACGGDGWHLDDIQAQKEDKVFHLLTHLKPYTQYAIYVKTYTIATERVGAQSPMMYVRTLPAQPSPPRITQAISLSPGSLILKWEPPASPHGNVTQYRVSVQWEEDKEEFFMQRNYCSEPLVATVNKPFEAQEETPKEKEEKVKKEENCQCDSKGWNDDEVIGKITFEDNLQNQVYAKRVVLEDNRRRRDVEATKERYGSHSFPEGNLNPQIQSPQDMQTVKVNGTYSMYFKTVEKTALNISHLRHYASHTISVCACREVEKEELDINDTNIDTTNCSIKSMVTARTMKLEGADNITDINVKVQQANQSLGVVRLDWLEPPKPNGLVVTFHIQYKRIDIENHSPTTECITRQQFVMGGGSYTIKGLNAGNYSVRVMATSLAGSGNYTALKYFYIEKMSNEIQPNKENIENNMLSRVKDKVEFNAAGYPTDKDLPVFYSPLKIMGNGKSTKRVHIKRLTKGASSQLFPRRRRRQVGRGQPGQPGPQ